MLIVLHLQSDTMLPALPEVVTRDLLDTFWQKVKVHKNGASLDLCGPTLRMGAMFIHSIVFAKAS